MQAKPRTQESYRDMAMLMLKHMGELCEAEVTTELYQMVTKEMFFAIGSYARHNAEKTLAALLVSLLGERLARTQVAYAEEVLMK